MIDLWHPWGECHDDKGWEWWRRTLGSCLLVTWSSSFAQGKEGPSVMEKGILISIWICFSLTKDWLFFFSLVYSWVFFIVWGYTFSVSIVCIEIVDWRVCVYVHASSDLQITLLREWSTTKIPTCFLLCNVDSCECFSLMPHYSTKRHLFSFARLDAKISKNPQAHVENPCLLPNHPLLHPCTP